MSEINGEMVSRYLDDLGKRYWTEDINVALNLDMLKEVADILNPTQEIRSWLHHLSEELGEATMLQLLPPELIDYIGDQLYPGARRNYPEINY